MPTRSTRLKSADVKTATTKQTVQTATSNDEHFTDSVKTLVRNCNLSAEEICRRVAPVSEYVLGTESDGVTRTRIKSPRWLKWLGRIEAIRNGDEPIPG